MNEYWYEKQGFKKNPFSIRPTSELVGVNKELKSLKTKISSGAICLLTGEYGTGKTAVLKNLIKTFKGKRKVIFYTYNRKTKTLELDKLLYNTNLVYRLFKIKPKKMILLLDEVNGLNIKEREDLLLYYQKGYLKSIVLVAKNKKDLNLNKELEKIIGKNLFKLTNLSSNQAVEMIRKRIGSAKFISDKLIKKIHSINPNTRTFLENCEDACRYAFESGSKIVELKHLKIINH